MEIRQADEKDALQFYNLLKVIGSESDFLNFGNEGINTTFLDQYAFLKNAKESIKDAVFVAVDNNRIVGFTLLRNEGDSKNAHRDSLGIAVSKDYWNKGVGTKLMEATINYAKEVNLEIISLDVRCDNVNAIHLYEKYGFKTIGTFEKFFKIEDKYYDAYIMNLYL